MAKDDRPLTDEELDTWDTLSTPAFEDPYEMIKRKMFQSLNNHIGEVNDQNTRHTIRQELIDTFEDMVLDKEIQDYQVICDETNNTSATVDKNVLNCDVYVKVQRTVDFIHVPVILGLL